MGLKIYLSGPMTGLPDYNYPAFHEAAKQLRAAGHEVYNPAEYAYDGPLDDFPIRQAFAEYARYITTEADAIALLSGWEWSHGAQAEYSLANVCGLHIMRVSE
jgi:hypothetical protein